MLLRLINVAAWRKVNSGFENVDRTHLGLASDKLVTQKLIIINHPIKIVLQLCWVNFRHFFFLLQFRIFFAIKSKSWFSILQRREKAAGSDSIKKKRTCKSIHSFTIYNRGGVCSLGVPVTALWKIDWGSEFESTRRETGFSNWVTRKPLMFHSMAYKHHQRCLVTLTRENWFPCSYPSP